MGVDDAKKKVQKMHRSNLTKLSPLKLELLVNACLNPKNVVAVVIVVIHSLVIKSIKNSCT